MPVNAKYYIETQHAIGALLLSILLPGRKSIDAGYRID